MKFLNKRNLFYSLVTLIVLSVTTYCFVRIITNDTRKETEVQMRELSNQSISTISQKLYSDSVCLHSIAETVGGSNMELNTEKLRAYLDRKRGIYGFGDIVVIDLEGKPLSAIGAKLPNLGNQAYYKLALQGKVVLHNGLSMTNPDEHLVRIATPLRRDGKTIAVLYGVYMPDQLRALLTEKLFDNSATSKLITSSGDVVTALQNHQDFHTVDSFFGNKLTEIAPNEEEHYFHLLHNNRQGFVFYKFNKEPFLASLTPMDMANFSTIDHARWYLSMSVPYELIASRSRTKVFQTTAFAFALLAIIGVLSFSLYRNKQKQRKELQTAYQEIQSLYRTIPTPIIRFRMEDGGIVLSDNRSFANLVGCPHETCQHRFRFFTKPEFIERIWNLPDGSHQMEMLIRGYGKKYIWHLAFLEITTKPEGREVLCVLANISQQHEELNKATLVSQTDALTGLANRRGIQEQLEPLLLTDSVTGALLIMDLDNFKQVNDRFGHQSGDHTLADFADMLVETLPDTSFISRYGGDEFVVFLPNVTKEQTYALADKVKEQLAKKFPLFVKTCNFGVSLGAVCVPEDGKDWDTLFKKVDETLYENKRQSKLGQHGKAEAEK
ncbi:MAG: diguanylate cyclase domain-containing protein [Phascolarctobacterium sp.]